MARRAAPLVFVGGALLLAASPSRAADEIALFNGRNFTGWTFFLEEAGSNAGGKGRIADFATILPGGVIEIRPSLFGALMTDRDYGDHRFKAEFRWPTEVDPKLWRNGGLFIKIMAPYIFDRGNAIVPRMYEVQVQKPFSGDLWVLGYHPAKLKTAPERSYKPFGTREPTQYLGERRHHNIKDAEKPYGEWNSIEYEVKGKDISVWVNGELVNQGTDLVDRPGRVGLISEGAGDRFSPIQWRNLRLTPLD